jgi:hypothetical protein
MPKTVNKDFALRTLERVDYDVWDRFVESSPQGSIFAKARYLDTLEVRFEVTVADRQGEILGGIVQSRNAFGLHSNPLFAKYLGVMHAAPLKDPHKTTSRDLAVDTLLVRAIPRHRVWSYTFAPDFDNWLAFYWAGFQQTTRYTYRLPLTHAADWRIAYDGKLRWAVSRATRDGLGAEPVSSAALANAVEASFLDLGKRMPLPRHQLERVISRLTASRDLRCLGVRHKDGRLLCAAGILQEERCSYLLFNGMKRAQAVQGANALLIDQAIEQAAAHSACFDFEGSMYAGIERFYRRFGACRTPYFAVSRGNLATRSYRWAEATARRLNR